MDTARFAQVDDYIAGLLAKEDDVLTGIISAIDREGLPQQSISPVQGKFLQVLMQACNAVHVLEVGTFCGYSTIWMARALPEEGKIITIEREERHAELARQHFEAAGLSDRIELRTGSAMEVLQSLVDHGKLSFDFIFIDADKPPYTEYFDLAVQLSRKGTMIVCDNVVRGGHVLDAHSEDERVQGVQRLNEALSTNNKVTATILQTIGTKEHDGMVMAVVNQTYTNE